MPQEEQSHNVPPEHDGTAELLTAREREVADLISQGMSNEQIAERLVLTPGTVANHVAHILSKLGLISRVQVAVRVVNSKTRSNTGSILRLLETLRQVESTTAREAMQGAADVLATVFAAEKVDAFFYDESARMLIALGTSQTALGKLQHELGLHRLPVSNGGRVAWVFREQRSYQSGHVEDDMLELVGVRRDLGVRSTIAAPIQVGGAQTGVLLASSQHPEQFTTDQLHLLQLVAYWIGMVARDHTAAEQQNTVPMTDGVPQA